MGNWRRVSVIGSLAEEDVLPAKRYLFPGNDFNNWTCLSFTKGWGGLGVWAKTEINSTGNLAERNYDVEEIVEALTGLVHVAPSLNVKIHCGDEYEDPKCIATISVSNRQIVVGKPEIEKLPEPNGWQQSEYFPLFIPEEGSDIYLLEGAVGARDLPHGMSITVYEMLHDIRIAIGVTGLGVYSRSWSYPKDRLDLAITALKEWDGINEPPTGWTKEIGE